MTDRMRLAFTLSTKNPFTSKPLRSYRKKGINGFISECYTQEDDKNNRFLADHCIAYCQDCGGQHGIYGMADTPSKAYNKCKQLVDKFTCPGKDIFEFA